MVCTRPTAAAAWVGEPCPDCRHTTLVHPGDANPGLSACALCELLDAVADLRGTRAQVKQRLDDVTAQLRDRVLPLLDQVQQLRDANAAADVLHGNHARAIRNLGDRVTALEPTP